MFKILIWVEAIWSVAFMKAVSHCRISSITNISSYFVFLYNNAFVVVVTCKLCPFVSYNIYYEDLWCQGALCLRLAQIGTEAGMEQDAARWRGWGSTTYFLPPWAHQQALIHRWKAERSSQTRAQKCNNCEWREELKRGGILRKTKASDSTLLRRIWGICVCNPTSEAECESK